MRKRFFSPLPQTTREAPGEKFQVLWRIYNTVPELYRERWVHVPLPRFMSETKWIVAKDLTKIEAECVRSYWAQKPGCACFEFRVIPMGEAV